MVLTIPIVYGSKSVAINSPGADSIVEHCKQGQSSSSGEAVPATHTHRWLVYVRSASDSETKKADTSMNTEQKTPTSKLLFSEHIKRVTLKLHDSFANPVRNLQSPFFEITETGWGEFDIVVKVWVSSSSSMIDPVTGLLASTSPIVDGVPATTSPTFVNGEKAISFVLPLKLYPTEDSSTMTLADGSVVNEYYDEIIIPGVDDPTSATNTTTGSTGATGESVSLLPSVRWKEREAAELAKLDSALAKVAKEIGAYQKRYNLIVQGQKAQS